MLTTEQVAEILEAQRLRRELSDKGLARKYGVTEDTIGRVLARGRIEPYTGERGAPCRARVGDAVIVIAGPWSNHTGIVQGVERGGVVRITSDIDGNAFRAAGRCVQIRNQQTEAA